MLKSGYYLHCKVNTNIFGFFNGMGEDMQQVQM